MRAGQARADPGSILSAFPARIAIMRRMIPDDLYDFVLIGAGVLVVCVLIAYSPFTDRPRYPMLFGILFAAFIMAVYLLAHLV
jgi:hypothetical protein